MATKATSKKKGRTGQVPPRPTGQTRQSYPNAPKKLNVKRLYMQGLSIREIARREKLDRATITKIVSAEDMESYIEEHRHKLLGLAPKALESLEFALENEADGRVASQFLEKFAVFPESRKPAFNFSQTNATQILTGDKDSSPRELSEQEVEERAIELMCQRLAQTAMERSKIFKTAMPELEELKAEKVK